MSFKQGLYDILVAKRPPIRRLYVRYKQHGASYAQRAVYLMKLSFAYYILGDKKLTRYSGDFSKPYCKGPESAKDSIIPPEKLAEQLCKFDAVSFDIFDTLIYRPFAAPTDLFHIVGAKTGILNFSDARQGFEFRTRQEKHKRENTYEIDIDEIYRFMSDYGDCYPKAEKVELETELELCFPNPYMKKVWEILREKNVRLVITSDMYLKADFLEKLLIKNGFDGFEKLFVSNEYGLSKYDGGLYAKVKEYLRSDNIAHVGDNEKSDIENSKKHGFTPFHVQNPNTAGDPFRPLDLMSRITGSAYAGLVNARFHSGLESYPMLYEYGYAYSGIFALGYCNYIRKLQLETGADKVLFLARDGDLLKKIYDKLYPDSDTEYFLWSRMAAVKLCFEENTLDFIRRFVYHKSSGSYTAEKIFRDMELEPLLEGFAPGDTVINSDNSEALEEYIKQNKEKIKALYSSQEQGAKLYFSRMLSGCKKALAVDVGWAGSGAASIASLAERWGIDVEIIGVIAGTNDSFAEQVDASEAMLQSGKLYSYCFSQRHNRHIYNKHDAEAGHNIFFEMLLGSPSPSLKGFAENGEPVFAAAEEDNAQTVSLIHKGALDFVSDYLSAFGKYPYMSDISGSDAYAPFLAAAEDGGKYFKAVLGNCKFNVDVGTENTDTVNAHIK